MKRFLLITTVIVILLWLALSAWFTVDRAEYVYLTRFGRHIATYDGAYIQEAGLHLKWPWPIETAQPVDHRLQQFDVPEMELLTHDQKGQTIDKTLTIAAYVVWRIADKESVDKFIRTVGTPDRARDILEQRVKSRLGAVVSNMPIDDLISVAPPEVSEQRMDRLRDRLLGRTPDSPASLTELAHNDYGIELVDVRLRRHNHPASVRTNIFNRIESERQKKVTEYESQGQKIAADIASDADLQAKKILTEANSEAERRRKEADIQADQIRNEAHSQDQEFYTFLRKLQAYQEILGETKDMLLLSSKHDLFDMLLSPPKPSPPRTGPSPIVRPMPKVEETTPGGNGR